MMQAMPYNLQQLQAFSAENNTNNNNNINNNSTTSGNNNNKNLKSNNRENNKRSSRTASSVESEPTSALDTSTSTLSSSFTGAASIGGAGVGGGADRGGAGGDGIGLDEWNNLFPNENGALLPWIMGDPDDPGLMHSAAANQDDVVVDFEGNAGVSLNPGQFLVGGGGGGVSGGGGSVPVSLQFPPAFDVVGVGKPQIYNPQLVMNQQQAHSVANPSFTALGNYCHQVEQFQPQAKRHNPGVILDPNLMQGAKNPFMDPGLGQFPMGLPAQLVPHHLLEEQGVKELLFKAADLIQIGNFSLAQEILARLNQQLSIQSKPPLIRATLYVKEALQMLLQLSNPVAAHPPKTLTPYDVVHKMNAYKVFSEVSPITQFVNFTCTQAILEALDDAHAIHVIDFDIGCGAQWASLIQELPLRKRGAPSLHITAVVPPTTHSFELALIRENLVQFANDTSIPFELQVVNLDSFDPSSPSFPHFKTSENECIAVNIPIWSSSTRPSLLPSILRFIKQRSPKIVVSFDRGFDRCDLPFPQHIIHSLESCTNFMESLDGLNVASNIINNIERFFVQPRIENAVLGRLHAPDKMPHWKNLFASSGLVPLQFSNFTETQADYVVKRTPGRGFHVEKRQASLVLSWQRRELVAASAWRC